MKFCKVVAIINITDFGQIRASLDAFDLPGVTVSPVKGFGDYVNEYAQYGFSDNLKIEIYTTEKQAEEIARVLKDKANEMTEGGGMVAIEPVTSLINVRKLNT
jgi:nitrogen regulatory protein PII